MYKEAQVCRGNDSPVSGGDREEVSETKPCYMREEIKTRHVPKTGGGSDFYTAGNAIKYASKTKAPNPCIKRKPHFTIQVLGNAAGAGKCCELWENTMTGPAIRESHSLMAEPSDISPCWYF